MKPVGAKEQSWNACLCPHCRRAVTKKDTRRWKRSEKAARKRELAKELVKDAE